MNRADRAASFSLFKYQPPVYSIGDRLYVAFEFADEDELRCALGPVGLEVVADLKVGSERLPLDGRELLAEILGPAVTLEVGPEERYEHLSEPDFAWAEALEARFLAAGLARYRIGWLSRDDCEIRCPAPARPPAPARREPRRMVITILGATGEGAVARVERRVDGAPSIFGDVSITAETRCFDLAGAPVEVGALIPGELAIASMTTGRGLSGEFGAVVDRLELLRPDADLVGRFAGAQEALRRAGVPHDDRAPALIARDFLLRREADPAWTVEAALDAELRARLHGFAAEDFGLLAAVVELSLVAFRDLRLPCLFQPHRALEDALERCRGGEPPDRVAADLLDVMLREAERSLERAGDARRFLPARLRTRPEVVTRLLLTEAARAALASAGILRLP